VPPPSPSEQQRRAGPHQFLLMAALSAAVVALIIAAYKDTLSLGFFCDDFEHLAFFKRVLEKGDWLAFVHCFGQPYLNATRELYYRPLVESCIALDCIIWQCAPFGLHLTNMAIHAGVSLLLAWVIFQLLKLAEPGADVRRLLFSSFACAAAFSIYPLLGESVIWMIGRVDSLCSLFYMGAFGCFLRYCTIAGRSAQPVPGDSPLPASGDCPHSTSGDSNCGQAVSAIAGVPWFLFSVVLFAAALCCKEMAVTLPVVALVFACMFAKQQVRAALAYFGVLLAYVGVRWFVLGTPMGGPVAVRSLHAPFLARLSDWDTYWRVLVPVKASLPNADILLRLLHVAWIGALVTLIKARPSKVVLFCLTWSAIAIVPALPVWYIGAELENGRLVYLLAAPLCSALVLACLSARSNLKFVPLAIFAIAFFFSTTGNVRVWANADAESRRFIDALRHLPGQTCIVNPPLIEKGVFEFFTGRSVHLALQLLPAPEARKAIENTTFLEPIFRPDQLRLINMTVLRDKLLEGRQKVALWTGEVLVPVVGKPASDVSSTAGLVSAPAEIAPPAYLADTRLAKFEPPISTLDYDYLDLEIQAKKVRQSSFQCYLTVIGSGTKGVLPPVHIPFDGTVHHRVCISDRLHWLAREKVHSVEVRLSDSVWRISSVKVTARSKREDSPIVSTPELNWEGVLRIAPDTTISADARAIPGAARLIGHVSNSHYRLMESKRSIFQAPVATKLPGKSFEVARNQATFSIPSDVLPDKAAYYELRLGALDTDGKPIGYWSDPVSITLKETGTLGGAVDE
jgi:hypothetical protein